MNWTPEQERALAEVGAWIRDGTDPIYYLFGYAGTGKTTLANYLAESVAGDVLFGAFTGKAASVLQAKGCPNAMTIHSMIYLVSEKSRRKLQDMQHELHELQAEHADPKAIAELKAKIEAERAKANQPLFTVNPEAPAKDASLIVIDEWSMVSERMAEDLLSFNVPILALGDPAQLPPVRGAAYMPDRPHTLLTEIHRQARDNPIIRLATMARTGEVIPLGEYGESRVVSRAQPEDALECDQILTGSNDTKAKCNNRKRELLEHDGPLPHVGERVVCLRNNHDRGLLNGTMWRVHGVEAVEGYDQLTLSINPYEGGPFMDVPAWRHHFEGRGKELCPWGKKDAEEFDFGYSLTVHKAQGSEWDSVLLFDQSHFFRGARRQWLYTAITRAAERVIIVRP